MVIGVYPPLISLWYSTVLLGHNARTTAFSPPLPRRNDINTMAVDVASPPTEPAPPPTAEEMLRRRRERKRAKKDAALRKRLDRIARNGGPPETTFVGKHKWLGGAVDPATGNIYGIPSHAHRIICVSPPPPPSSSSSSSRDDPSTSEAGKARISTILVPEEFRHGKFKWLRGVIHGGHLYGIPAWSTKGVLKMNLETKRVAVLPLPRDRGCYASDDLPAHERASRVDRGRWMWHGGAVGASIDEEGVAASAIYCPPSNAEHVLKVRLDGSDRVEEIGPPLSEGQNKWYGGILGADGCVYAPPYTATGVLRIDPRDDSVEVIGDFPPGKYLWHGGLLAESTGVIYAFPAHSNEVLCIDTNPRPSTSDGRGAEEEEDKSWRVSTIPIRRHEEDTDSPDLRYKWLGGSYGADGCIYGMPSDATTVLRIDPVKNEATTFGKVSGSKNKWQGGVLSRIDKCVYAVPADDPTVLRIDTDPSTPPAIDYVGSGFQDVDDKWQGGFVGRDGRIYAIPENCNQVMAIAPGGEGATAEMLTGLEE